MTTTSLLLFFISSMMLLLAQAFVTAPTRRSILVATTCRPLEMSQVAKMQEGAGDVTEEENNHLGSSALEQEPQQQQQQQKEVVAAADNESINMDSPKEEEEEEEPVVAVQQEEEPVAAEEEEPVAAEEEPVVAEEEPVVAQETTTTEQSDSPQRPKIKINRERHSVFIGNVPFETTDEELRELCSPHGTVQLISIPSNRETGRKRGFAFVDMSTPEEVDKVVEALQDVMLGDRKLNVNKSVPKDQMSPKEKRTNDLAPGLKKLYVGNIPFDSNEGEILEMFAEYGEVTEVFIPKKPSGDGRGFAFVTMKEQDAITAMEATAGAQLGGRTLYVNEPLARGERRQNRASQQTKIYVGNLSFYTVPETVEEVFGEFGQVLDCYLPEDRMTGGSRGFGFVTMKKDDAMEAIAALDGCEVDGRELRVNEAQAKERGPPPPSEEEDYDDEF